MQQITVYENAEGCWPDLDIGKTRGAELVSVGAIDGGMSDGTTGIVMRCELEDGTPILVSTSLAILRGLVESFKDKKSGECFRDSANIS